MRFPPVVFVSAVLVWGCSREPAPSPGSAVAPAPLAAPSSAGASSSPGAGAAGDAAQVGKPAPDFKATSYDGKPVDLATLKGNPVVVYFYPRDETPGCTKEACSFRDNWQKLAKTKVTLIGISVDSAESHKKFVEHWGLPFILVSDPDGAIAAKFGVPIIDLAGHKIESRQTFVIGADGLVKKIYRVVDVSQHADDVLQDLAS